MMNQDALDAMAVVSFIIGMANLNENLTQNDKDDILRCLDRQTKDILERIEKSLEDQNAMLKEILRRLD